MVDITISRKRIIWFLIASLFISMIRIDIAEPATIYVDDDGTADFTSIQAAIDSANIGDTIYVYAGIYRESLLINKDLTLIGENKNAIIECPIQQHGIVVTANNVEIKGFSIRNSSESYYGVYMYGVDNCIIRNCNFSFNYGGIYLYNGRNNLVIENEFFKNSYGISAIGLEDSVIRENFFIKNFYKGIDLGTDTRNNTLFYNSFISNNIDAYDESIFINYWYCNTVGNYWEKYNGVDNDGDGIGDTPYPIEPLEKGNFDYYPLMEPYAGYDIFPPDIMNLQAIPQIQVPGGSVNISCKIIDNVEVNVAYVNITLPNGSYINNSLNKINNTDLYYYNSTFSTKGVYYYYVWTNDTNNNSEKSPVNKFVIAYKPVANFTYSPFIPTELDNVTFDASASYDSDGSIVNYTWDFGDGNIGYGKIVTHRYALDGNYTVRLTVYDNDGAWDIMERGIFVANIPPVANFSFSPLQPIVGQIIQFNDSSYDPDGDIYIWRWDFGDGTILEGGTKYQNPTHAYTKDGVFNVTLTVTDNDYASSNITKQIVVLDIYPPEISNISAFPNPQEINQFVNISCEVYDNVEVAEVRVNITLPNGSYINNSMLNNSNYYYNIFCDLDGVYYYYIWARDRSGNANKSSIQNFTVITPPDAPHIENITIAPPEQQYGFPVNISCYVYDNVAVGEVRIFFSNGNYSMLAIADAKGNGIYYYNSTFDMGWHEFYIYAVDINGYENTSTNYSFKIIDTLPPSITNVSFSSISQPGNINISCNVYDNRGVAETRINITLPNGSYINNSMFSLNDLFYLNSSFNPGEYSFFIWARDISNNTASSSIYNFTVTYFPVANFTFSPLQPTDLETVYFTDSSYDLDGNIVNWTWNFGDGSIAYEQNPMHQYADDGVYNITLIVTDNYGATGEITKQIVVTNVPPVANFSYNPANPTTSDIIQFYDSSYDSDGSIVNYTWDFGDGIIAYGKIVQHKYSYEGIYIVNLTVKDDDGAISWKETEIVVSTPQLIANFSYSPENPVSLHVIQFIDLSYGAASWLWNFGDGGNATEQNPTHIYLIGNYYNVTLTIFNGSVNASISKVVRVDNFIQLIKNENNVVNYIPWLSNAITASQLASMIGSDVMPAGSVISRWNTSSGSFDSYIVGVSPPEYDFVIRPYDVVVLRVASSGTFNETAIQLQDRIVSLIKNTKNVVNHIVWSCLYSTKASQLASMIGSDVMPAGSVISRWNTSSGSFDSYIVGVSPPEYDFVIQPGDCIVLRVANSGEFLMEVMK